MIRASKVLRLSTVVLALSGMNPVAGQPAEPERIPLWPDGSPVGIGEEPVEDVEVFMTVHRPEQANGTAMVICPGGGYGGLVTGGEGHGIAAWLGKHGITGVVLEYRLPRERPFVPWLDACRAIRAVRARAGEWKLGPDRIGIIGFSAGGHLAATTLTHFQPGDPEARDPIGKVGSRPDFGILVYPVVTMGEATHAGSRQRLLGKNPSDELVRHFSPELNVSKDTPPVFLAHAIDDKVVVPENSRMLHRALEAREVPTRLLELESGGHGLNGYKGPMWDAWQREALAWLRALEMIP